MNKDYTYVKNHIDGFDTKKEKLQFIISYLQSHNKNLTKTQDFILDDAASILEDKSFIDLFRNVAEGLADIYEFLHINGEDSKELDKKVSELYYILNSLELKYKN